MTPLASLALIMHVTVWCAPFPMIEKFVEQDDRRLVAVAKAGPDQVRLYVNPENHKWALISIDPENIGCVLGSGDNFDVIPPKPGDRDA